MNIEHMTWQYDQDTDRARICIDDSIDMVVIKTNGKYTINVVKNNCFELELNEIEFEEE